MKLPHWPTIGEVKNIDLGLSRVRALLDALDNPQENLPPVIHVAGTNGKGSTIAFMRSILQEAGYSCHVYTSPHLIEFNERIVLAGRQIDDNFLTEIMEECRLAARGIDGVTFFEGTAAGAFLAFSRVPADVVLLETGLGGRLDATNVIAQPALSVITSIAIDHSEYLGDTLEKIALEKAGIIKNNVKCISAPQDESVMKVLREKAQEMSAEIIFSEGNEYQGVALGLHGEHQYINADLAVSCLENLDFNISDENIARGLQKAVWPARMQRLVNNKLMDNLPSDCELWLDGGHNPKAAEAIANVAKKWGDEKDLYIIIGMMARKDVDAIMENLRGISKCLYAVDIVDYDHTPKEEIVKVAQRYSINATSAQGLSQAIGDISDSANRPFRILICGSLFLAAEVLAQKVIL